MRLSEGAICSSSSTTHASSCSPGSSPRGSPPKSPPSSPDNSRTTGSNATATAPSYSRPSSSPRVIAVPARRPPTGSASDRPKDSASSTSPTSTLFPSRTSGSIRCLGTSAPFSANSARQPTGSPNIYLPFALKFVISLTLLRRSVASTVPLPIRQAHRSPQSESSATGSAPRRAQPSKWEGPRPCRAPSGREPERRSSPIQCRLP